MEIDKSQGCYRVLHTADWHLGKMLGERHRDEEHRRFLAWLLETLCSEEVDALIIAGDLFDSARPPQSAVRQYYEFLASLYHLRRGSCRVIVTAGNHDSPAHLDAPREILKALSATVVGELPATLEDAVVPLPDAENPALIVAAIPFLRDRDLRTGVLGENADEIRNNLRAGIANCYARAATACVRPQWSQAARLAVGHLTVQGAKSSDSERDIHIGGLGAVGTEVFPSCFDYVALGHLHRPQVVGGSDRVCYSGSPIPLSFGESQDVKSVRIVDFADGQRIANCRLEVPNFRTLSQVKCRRPELEETLRGVSLPSADLTTWVELLVSTADSAENLNEVIREISPDLPFEIARVIALAASETASLAEADVALDSAEALLSNPIDVFNHLLDQQVDFTDDELLGLRTAFAELRDLELASRDEDGAASATGTAGAANAASGRAESVVAGTVATDSDRNAT